MIAILANDCMTVSLFVPELVRFLTMFACFDFHYFFPVWVQQHASV